MWGPELPGGECIHLGVMHPNSMGQKFRARDPPRPSPMDLGLCIGLFICTLCCVLYKMGNMNASLSSMSRSSKLTKPEEGVVRPPGTS